MKLSKELEPKVLAHAVIEQWACGDVEDILQNEDQLKEWNVTHDELREFFDKYQDQIENWAMELIDLISEHIQDEREDIEDEESAPKRP